MNKNMNRQPPSGQPTIRCAVYGRKSTDEGLDKDFNSLDAQRECGEAYVKSQAQEGWRCLPDHYEDGGFTGGNMERPALKRLLADIEAGRIDCVVVYKVDRLSRSLLDFARMMEVFEKHNVAFVSVTQQINSATSMGRLMLNVLLSFAQFEREIIGERTRDKIAAARRKGKWSGGHPILGYDIDPQRFKLLVNEDEAAKVRVIFDLYITHEALIPVVQELERRGWLNKRWTTRKGQERGGKSFTKTSLHKLLTNVAYIGKVKYKTETHNGEHAGIVSPEIWQRVQSILRRNGISGGALVRNRFGAILKGLVRCVPCDCAMIPSHTTRNGNRRYRYYTCTGAQKMGWDSCPTKSIPAGEIERFVVEQIKTIGTDPKVMGHVLEETRAQHKDRIGELNVERRSLDRDLGHWNSEVHKLVEHGTPDSSSAISRLADLQERIRTMERRVTEINEELVTLSQQMVDQDEVASALALFDPVWESLTPREQTRIVQLLVERIDYDGAEGKVSITFHPSGIQSLAEELSHNRKEKIA